MSEITGIQPIVSGWATSVEPRAAAGSSGPRQLPAPSSFAHTLERTSSGARIGRAPGVASDGDNGMRAQKKAFETFVMQQFVESMLPENTGALYGDGTAGRMWRSMLAEQMAGSIVQSGRISLLPEEPATPGKRPGHTTMRPADPSAKE